MSGNTLEFLNDNWSIKEKELNFEKPVKVAEWNFKWKYPRMIARLPRELEWAYRAVE